MVTAGTKRAAENGLRPALSGKKLAEAAEYLRAARTALLNWTREAYANSENLDPQVDHIAEVLAMTQKLEDQRVRVEFKGRLFGI